MTLVFDLDAVPTAIPAAEVSRWPRSCSHGADYSCGCAYLACWTRAKMAEMERAMRAPGQ